MNQFPAKARYRCFSCGRCVDGDRTGWLQDEDGRGYPFCSPACRDLPWPLSDITDGQHLNLWSPSALVLEYDPS